jgi:predicted dehydrogenase
MSMAEAHNAEAPPPPLRVAWWGERQDFAAFQAAIDSCLEFHLIACGGMAKADAPPNLEWLADGRAAIESGKFDALVLSGPPRDNVSLAQAALDAKINVWQRPPLGRDFAESAAMAKLGQEGHATYVVGSWWEHVAEAWEKTTGQTPAFAASFAEARVSTVGPTGNDWRALRTEAGGGALLLSAYDLLECLSGLLSTPEAVYAVTGRSPRAADAPPRDSEDWGAALLRYADGASAVVRAAWDIGANEERLALYSAGQSLSISRESVTLTAGDARSFVAALPADRFEGEMRRFARAILDDAYRAGPAVRTLRRHLAVSAVLEAAYLSARTSHPESPRTFFELEGAQEPRV